jgi:SAM-dependent methyltransferase
MNSSVFYRRVKSPAFSAILGQREMTRAVVETIANEVSALSERTVKPDVVLVALPIVRDQRRLRLLDVGCGTGRFLNFVKQCWARLPCIGLDMSEPYLREARRHLNGRSWLKLVAGNREMDAYTRCDSGSGHKRVYGSRTTIQSSPGHVRESRNNLEGQSENRWRAWSWASTRPHLASALSRT